MTIGGSIALLVIGAILRYAINWSSAYVDLRLVGLILMIAGAAGLIIALTLIMMRRQRSAPRTEVYEQRHYTESPPGYNQPRQGSNQPPNYNQPPPNYSEPPRNYNQPPPNYNEPQGSYNQPPPNYSEPQGSYNQPPGSYTEPLPGSGEPPRDYKEPPTEVYEQRRYNEPPH